MKPKGTMSCIDHATPSAVKVDSVQVSGASPDYGKYLDIIGKRMADLCDVVQEKEMPKADESDKDHAADAICHAIQESADMIHKAIVSTELKISSEMPKMDVQVAGKITVPNRVYLLVAVPIIYAMALHAWLLLHH